jgi:hypothetical protein
MNTHRGRLLIGLLIALTIWGFVDVRRRGFPTPVEQHKSDLTVYTEAGAAFFDGRPPYRVCNPRGWTYVYPPIFALLLAPLHALPMQDQVTVWFFLCLLMCWGIYRESARIIRGLRTSDDDKPLGPFRWLTWLGAIAAMTVALPALNCLQRGQVSIAVLYMMLLGLRWIVESRTSAAIFFGGMLISMSVAIKIVPMLPIAFFLFIQWINDLRQRWQSSDVAALLGRRWAAATAGTIFGLVLFFLLIPAALIGWRANVQHLNTWAQLVLVSASDSTATPGFEKDTHSVRNQCLGNALYRLGNFGEYVLAGGPEDPLVDDDHPPPRMMDAASVNTCLFFVRIAILCTLMLVGFRLSQSNDARLAQVTGFGLACAAMLVLSPVARNHYFVLFTPAALFVPFWFHRMGHRFFAVWMAVVPCVLILLQYVLMPYVGRIGLLGLGMTGWLMASMVVMERISRGAIVSATGASMEPSKIFLPNAA